MQSNQQKNKTQKEQQPAMPPVQKVPDKNKLPKQPEPEKNPSGNRDNKPEEQNSG